MEKLTGKLTISSSQVNQIKKEIKDVIDLREAIKDNLKKTITGLTEIILGGAINLNASDIHFEPYEKECKIRLRIDGILQEVFFFSLEIYQALLSRIKLLSGIKLNVTDKPQDGRFSVIFNENLIEIRASTLPTEYGEAVVLRILNPQNLINMEALGLREDLFKQFIKEIKQPHGMIIVTGPTGSGKTTTLYAFLKKIQRPEIKIITIEDPIEYNLEGISQTQVDPSKGYDFASGLKSIMRQDPDVILVGEIRDLETAEIALQAALTGHLVLTTLHANDAASTVARLIALGAKPAYIGPALNITIAQRLVRKICPKCAQEKVLSSQEIKKIKKNLKEATLKVKIPKLVPGFKIPVAKGCKYCNFTGYRGRIGIFEAFPIDSEVERFILSKPSISALRELAIKKGMVPMKQDGILKVLNGITTLEEIERVTGPLSEIP